MRWSRRGIWEVIAAQLASKAAGESPEPSAALACLDSTHVKVHQHGAVPIQARETAAVGVSRGGKTTKLHLLSDASKDAPFLALGTMHGPGNRADVSYAARLLAKAQPKPRAMVADKAYDCADLRAWCQKAKIRSHLPTRRNSRHRHRVDRDCYRQRQVVERFFCRLKQFRRVATRYDRLLMTWAATVALALVRVMVTAGEIGGMG